jgi:hypothetical protein
MASWPRRSWLQSSPLWKLHIFNNPIHLLKCLKTASSEGGGGKVKWYRSISKFDISQSLFGVVNWLSMFLLTNHLCLIDYSKYRPLQLSVKSRNFLSLFLSFRGRDSSVSIALGYGLDDGGSWVQFLARAGNFPLHHCIQTGSGAHPASHSGALPLGVKRPGREADHSPPSSAEVKECMELYLHSPIRLYGIVLS